MRRAMNCIVATLAAGVCITGVAQAASSASNPTRSQIRRAVTHAERSSYLWATFNVCLPSPWHGGVLGVRGEMGALGFGSTLSMTVRLRQYDSAHREFVAVKGSTATRTVSLGTLRTGVHQGGAEFHYSADTGLLDATITFTWSRGGHRLGQLTRTTTDGHHAVAFAEPVGHSTATCRL